MIQCRNNYQIDFIVVVIILTGISVVTGSTTIMIDPGSLISSALASSTPSNKVLQNKTQDIEEMLLKPFLYSKDVQNQSAMIKSEPPILYQTDHNTNFRILPNLTGMLTEEVPFFGNGTIKGISYNHTGFFSGVWNLHHNILQYHGAVELTTMTGDRASYSVHGLSKIDSNGNVAGNGIALFNTNSSGDISFLGGMKIYYEDKIKNPTASDSPHRITGWLMK